MCQFAMCYNEECTEFQNRKAQYERPCDWCGYKKILKLDIPIYLTEEDWFITLYDTVHLCKSCWQRSLMTLLEMVKKYEMDKR